MKNTPTKKTLFFGRKNCAGTEKGLALLEALGFDITAVISEKRGEKMPAVVESWEGDYIFCFRSFYILRKPLLQRARVAAINFHPAPPEYPGSGCINFALYENASNYGATAHIMDEKIDSGAIIKCARFPILPADTVARLLPRAHESLAELFSDVIHGIAKGGQGYIHHAISTAAHEKWRGTARKMAELNALQEITTDTSPNEVERRIRAVHTDAFPLYIMENGKKTDLSPAAARALARKKNVPEESTAAFIKSVIHDLSSAGKAYKDYMAKDRTYAQAQVIKRHNAALLQRIADNKSLIPANLTKDFTKLETHLHAWCTQWNTLDRAKSHAPHDVFTFETAIKFPQEAEKRIKAFQAD